MTEIEKQVRQGVRRWNSMRTRFINTYNPSYNIPKANVKEILRRSSNDKELKIELALLNDLKKITDFNLIKGQNITRVENNQYARLSKNAKRTYNKQLKKANDNIIKLVEEGANGELINKEIAKRDEYKSKLKALQYVKSPKAKRGSTKRLTQEAKNMVTFGTVNFPEEIGVSQEHYMAALTSIGILNHPDGGTIIDKIYRMTQKEWINFCKKNPRLADLQWVYDITFPLVEKVNTLRNALNIESNEESFIDEDFRM